MIADYIVGTIIGGAIGGIIFLIFFKILENPYEKLANYLEKQRGWPEWKISLFGYPLMLLALYYYIHLIIWIVEILNLDF